MIHRAPWGRALRLSSALLVALAGVMAVAMPRLMEGAPIWTVRWCQWSLPAVLICCLPFVVRGYQIAADAVWILRPGWKTRWNRNGGETAELRPRAMRRCFRTFGNGGGFSFTGWYWNREFGHFRAFVTDLDRTVVLRSGRRVAVISPEDPEKFVHEFNAE